MEDFAIRVSGLGKKYRISRNETGLRFSERLRELLIGNKSGHVKTKEEFYALKNINFVIKKGEAVGIIGKNGAGKSTLLKLLSEVAEPSSGTIEINGKVASVLEVGMGFHPELSGRENVFLSGTMLGIPKKKINEKFDEIVAFSGVEKFIDMPVKHYSSGMYVRLAFSVVANIDADILLFDEVLNVGDAAFQAKSFEKIRSLIAQHKTVLLVSHNLNDVSGLCNSFMYLNAGELVEIGGKQVVEHYNFDAVLDDTVIGEKADPSKENTIVSKVEWTTTADAPGDETTKCLSAAIRAKDKKEHEHILFNDKVVLDLLISNTCEQDVEFGFTVKHFGSFLLAGGTSFQTEKDHLILPKAKFVLSFEFPDHVFLSEGFYSISIYGIKQGDLFLLKENILQLRILANNLSFYESRYGVYPGPLKINTTTIIKIIE